MKAPRIPDRQPVGDLFEGVLLQVDKTAVLATTPIDEYNVLYAGEMIVRYGVTFLGKPQSSIVPGLLALDYGAFMTGEEAWEFLFQRSNLYPRADVLGYRNDGEDDMAVIKTLDLEFPLHVLAYENEEATRPLARVRALITDNQEAVAARIRQHLPIFPTVEAWLEA